MRIINPKCDKDTFKYSVLISLHFYDINCHPEILTKLKPFENSYNFSSTEYSTFEKNNPSISLTVINKNNNTIHNSMNNTDKRVTIVKLKENTFVSIKPSIPSHIKPDRIFSKYSHKEMSDFIMSKIIIK